jgi:hypothetical protein
MALSLFLSVGKCLPNFGLKRALISC